jgi:formate-dependent nitrite reductase membrane component NrfD
MAVGRLAPDRMRDLALATIALIFTALTTLLLVWDLEHKARFLRVVFTPQKKSWLARGAFILIAYSGLSGLFWLAAFVGYSARAPILLWATVIVGFMAAIYTAFLFGQCEGRDLWQTPLLPAHLAVQAVLCGAAVLMLLPAGLGGSPELFSIAAKVLAASVGLHLLMVLGEMAMPHSTDNSAYAARLITHGPFRNTFWGAAIALGGVAPILLVLMAPESGMVGAIAGLLALGGLLAFEWCFVMAGQSVPNS